MDMSMEGMDMGDMPMGDGIPSLLSFQQNYWAVIGSAIALGTAVNIASYLMYRQRISAAARSLQQPAKPKTMLLRCYATITAVSREFSSAALPALSWRAWFVRMPLAGKVSLVLANLTTLVVMCFYGWDTMDLLNYEDIGYRTGFVTIMQLPLIFMLAGKKNVVGWLTGYSYERLNWLHRWSARLMFITATIHFGYWLADWWPYGDFVSVKIKTDPITWRGLVAWCILGWINLSSSMPIRGWGYEFFVVQHVVSFAVMVGFIWWHVPSENHVWIWIVTAFFWFDRVARGLNVLYNNLSIFHPRQRKSGNMGLWACNAELTALPHDTTKITINDPPISWKPGQHMFLSCHSIVPLQSHPFTAASLPSDGKLEFFVQAQGGGSRRFLKHAEKLALLPSSTDSGRLSQTRSVSIEGPYGGSLRNLRQFDSVVLFAGSTGATFVVPLLRDIVACWKASGSSSTGGLLSAPNVAVTRYVRLVWCVKSRGQLAWFATQLASVVEDVDLLRKEGLNVEVDMSIYCTCDEKFTEEHKSLLSAYNSNSSTSPQGRVEIRASESSSDEKVTKKATEPITEVRELDEVSRQQSLIGSDENRAGGRAPSGCCCKTTVEDEDAITGSAGEKPTFTCCCGATDTQKAAKSVHSDALSRATSAASWSSKFLCHPSIALFSGRPQCRNIMRKSLEQALGESAVVVCGPRGLIEDIRRAYVGLCDERAVCKGTGAMGVYYHAEGFSY